MKPLIFLCQIQSPFSPPRYGNYSPVPTGNQLHIETPTRFAGGGRGLPMEILQDAAVNTSTFSACAVSLAPTPNYFN